jgi:ABC-type uncharacterized transport system involved in gliding motility auxiliary subunit
LLLAALALVNYIAARHNQSFDLTESGLFTLSSQTRQVLHTLNRNVRLLAFVSADGRAQAASLLRRYAQETPRLSYEIVDPDQDPDAAQRYGVTAYGTVVVLVQPAPGEPKPSGQPIRVEAEPAQGNHPPRLTEEKLTNGLLKVTRGGTKTIYFLEGHGEADIASPEPPGYSGIRHLLEGQSFLIKRLSLAREPQVPGDCSVLILAGPSVQPFSGEMAAIERYLQRGGKAMFLLDPAPGVGLEKFLDHWGVRVDDDVIMDLSGAGRALGYGPAVPLVRDYDGQHPITKSFRLTTLFPIARSLTPKDDPGDASVSPLAQTSADSFAEPYAGGPRRLRFDPAHDRKGPLLLAVAVTREAKGGQQARLVVVGDSDFISNANFSQGGNGDFFLRSINWLAEEEELIAIQPHPLQDRRVALTEQQARGIFWLVVIALPLAALGLGISAHWRRRA